jgi:hypothetical protein
MNVADIAPFSYLRVFTRVDGHPMKETVNTFSIERLRGNLETGFISSDTDSYDIQSCWSWRITQKWLDDPRNVYEILESDRGRNIAYGESSLKRMTPLMFLEFKKQSFHLSRHFKYDVDGLEGAHSGYRFSKMRKLRGDECVERRADGWYETVASRHQPVPLRVAKFLRPPTITLADGQIVKITHLSELGELIYDPVGLRSVKKSLLTREAYDIITHHRADFGYAEELEDFLVGDEPIYRASSLEMPEFSEALRQRDLLGHS